MCYYLKKVYYFLKLICDILGVYLKTETTDGGTDGAAADIIRKLSLNWSRVESGWS
jgi:hypothetical protein